MNNNRHSIGEMVMSRGLLGQIIGVPGDKHNSYGIIWFNKVPTSAFGYTSRSVTLFKRELNEYQLMSDK